MESKEKDTNELIYKTEIDIEDKLTVNKADSGEMMGTDKLGVWDWHIHTTIYKIGKQQGFTV